MVRKDIYIYTRMNFVTEIKTIVKILNCFEARKIQTLFGQEIYIYIKKNKVW